MVEGNFGSEPSGDVDRLERSMLSSWPALSTAFDGDWVIRLSEGHTKRSNSVTCLGDDPTDLEQRIDRVEAVYERHGLPPVFRLSPLASPALDRSLEDRGWRRFDETIVMTLAGACSNGREDAEAGLDIEISSDPDDAWLNAYRRIDGMGRAPGAILERMLSVMIPKAGYARAKVKDDIGALALGVVDGDLIGLFEVMTAKDYRRHGLARRLLGELLVWGRQEGARTAWLAVVAANEPAVRLYRSLCFQDVYRYHYRAKD